MDLLSPRALGAMVIAVSIARLLAAVPAHAQDREAQGFTLLRITPARLDSVLVCTVDARGLPPPESRSTLESGLPSSLVVDLSLLDGDGDEITGRRTEIRLEPDLWEGVFHLRTPLIDHRCPDMDDLMRRLQRLGPLPLTPLAPLRLRPGDDLRVRARVAVHALAPEEKRGFVSLFRSEGDAGRRETSVGIGRLFRFFLGREEDEPWVSEVRSAPFSLATLPALVATSDSSDVRLR